MDTGAITHLLSANHRALIVLGGAISFLSLFLPFLEIIGNNSISFVFHLGFIGGFIRYLALLDIPDLINRALLWILQGVW